MFSLKHHKLYWVFQNRLIKIRFVLQKSYYRILQKAMRSRDDFSVIRFLIGKTTAGAFVSLLIFLFIIVFDWFCARINNPQWVAFQIVVDQYRVVQAVVVQHGDLVRDTLIAIASLSGFLLGLYFTAISVVVSSRFVAISPGMREHFLREPGGQQYLRVLAITTVWSLVLLGYAIFGGVIGLFSLGVILLLGMFGIAGFLYLSVRAFYFLDPTTLSDSIFSELIRSAKCASSQGRMWTIDAFQNRFRQQAVYELNSIESMLELASRESHLTRDSLRILLAKCAVFLGEYLKLRFRIPSQSLWYRRMPRHENYFLADDTRLTMAIQTGGYVQPGEIPDLIWLEKDMVSSMARSLVLLPSERRLSVAYSVLIHFHPYFESLGLALEVRHGRGLITELIKPVSIELASEQTETIEQRELHLAAYDTSRLCYLSIVLGCLKFMATLDLGRMVDRCSKVDWLSQKDIYELQLPPAILKNLEELRGNLQFENVSERGTVSPQWYTSQLILKHVLDQYKDALNAGLEILDEEFVAPAGTLTMEGKFVLTALHCQRGLELCSKLMAHLPKIEQVWLDSELYRIEKEIPWPAPDWTKVKERIEAARRSIVGSLAKCLPAFLDGKRDERLPDLFGQGYNIVCWECYQALCENDKERFADLFPILAISAMHANNYLRQELSGWLPETQIAIAGDPVLDLIDISGYAIVYSELYSNPDMWSKCEQTWNTLLKTHAAPKDLLTYIVTLYEYRHGDLRISPRQTIRTRWKMLLNEKLQQMGLISDFLRPGYLQGMHQSLVHQSNLINALCHDGHEPMVPIVEVFLVQYILKRPEGTDIAFADRYDLKRSLGNSEDQTHSEE